MTGGSASASNRAHARDVADLRRLLDPKAITIVGASPNGQITDHLLRNLDNRSCRFDRPVHLINPKYTRIFDRPCLASVADVPGDPGLVYLLVPAEQCVDTLDHLSSTTDGVILYQEPSRTPGGYETVVADWGRQHGVGILGAQSTGVVSVTAGLLGLLVPIVEDLRPGGVALLSQSGGVLGGMVKYLAEEGVGIHSAMAFGTSSMLSPEDLGMALLADDSARLLGLYADGLESLDTLAELLSEADRADKAVVMMVGGATAAGRRAAASHSGAAATPRRIIEGLARQYNAILAETLDEFVWSIAALAALGFERPVGHGVALFTDSGGGGITMVDAIAGAGISLPDPGPGTLARLGSPSGTSWNPFDFGSRSLGQITDQAEIVVVMSADDRYGICAYASTQGIPIEEHAVQIRQIDQFIAAVQRSRKTPFIASPFPFGDRAENASIKRDALVGLGSTESAAKLRALAIWAQARTPTQEGEPGVEAESPTTAPDPSPTVTASVFDMAQGQGLASGLRAATLLRDLPLTWPKTVEVSAMADLDVHLGIPFPMVLKSEAGHAHRVVEGGVLLGIATQTDLMNGARYLLDRFGGRVSITEFVPHEDEYFIGAVRRDRIVLILMGAGGREAESADVGVAPLTPDQAARLVAPHAPRAIWAVSGVILALQTLMLDEAWIEAVDLNPLVVTGHQLIALDAKVHGLPPSVVDQGQPASS